MEANPYQPPTASNRETGGRKRSRFRRLTIAACAGSALGFALGYFTSPPMSFPMGNGGEAFACSIIGAIVAVEFEKHRSKTVHANQNHKNDSEGNEAMQGVNR